MKVLPAPCMRTRNVDAEGSTAGATESEELGDVVLKSVPSTGVLIYNKNISHKLTDSVIEM